MSVVDFELLLTRNTFGPQEAARAGDLWRLCQDAALLGSSARGWDPARYRREGVAFVLRRMTAVHHRQVAFGDPITGQTWVRSFRRGMFSNRQIELRVGERVVTEATQEWIHVSQPDLKITRAAASMLADFAVVDRGQNVCLPAFSDHIGAEHEFSFDAWFTWMDPLNHANHPLYVDWCDESINRLVAERGLDPHGLEAVAEKVLWKSGVVAPERVTVKTALSGRTEAGDAVFSHQVLGQDDRICALATSVRRLKGSERGLADLLG